MTPHMTPSMSHLLVTLAVVALIAWRLQARFRRLVGRQRLSPVRPWATVILFPVLVGLLALGSAHTSLLLNAYLAVGVALGVTLGVLGLRMTRFEVASDGLYYTPSAHLGVALSLLLVARVVWRFLSGGMPGPAGLPGGGVPPPPSATTLTPLTLLLIGMLAGYYFTYAAGLLRWAARARSTARSEVSP